MNDLQHEITPPIRHGTAMTQRAGMLLNQSVRHDSDGRSVTKAWWLDNFEDGLKHCLGHVCLTMALGKRVS